MVTPEAKPTPRTRYWQNSDFWLDAVERIATVFIFTFSSTLAIDNFTAMRATWQQAVLAGALAAVGSTVKAAIGAQRKDSTTPVSLL